MKRRFIQNIIVELRKCTDASARENTRVRLRLKPFDAHGCHMGTAIKHPVPDRVKPSFLTSGYSDAQGRASEYPDVKNYK